QASATARTGHRRGPSGRRPRTEDASQHPSPGGPSGRATMKFAIVIERAGRNWSAYAPDVPGCVATGKTADEARDRLREAIRLHLEGMREDGQAPPVPTTVTDTIEV